MIYYTFVGVSLYTSVFLCEKLRPTFAFYVYVHVEETPISSFTGQVCPIFSHWRPKFLKHQALGPT